MSSQPLMSKWILKTNKTTGKQYLYNPVTKEKRERRVLEDEDEDDDNDDDDDQFITVTPIEKPVETPIELIVETPIETKVETPVECKVETNFNFIGFTIERIDTYLNKKGVEKKKPIGMPNKWTERITAENYNDFIDPKHKAWCFMTGKISNIIVIDFDYKDSYDKMCIDYPDLKKHKTVQTKRGYHIYCKYASNILTTTDGLVHYKGIDIASDGHMVFAPPTSYFDLGMNEHKYVDLGGEY